MKFAYAQSTNDDHRNRKQGLATEQEAEEEEEEESSSGREWKLRYGLWQELNFKNIKQKWCKMDL